MAVVTPLAALIKKAQDDFLDANGVELSYGDIARRAQLSRSRISQLAAGPLPTVPPHETLEMLARGLRVSYDLVLQRALESAGYDVPDRWPAPMSNRPAPVTDLQRAARRGKPLKTQGQDEQQV